ncbi:MAG: hypothetical protein ACXWQZ_24325, partial [Ktedonobacterales bacterium]
HTHDDTSPPAAEHSVEIPHREHAARFCVLPMATLRHASPCLPPALLIRRPADGEPSGLA